MRTKCHTATDTPLWRNGGRSDSSNSNMKSKHPNCPGPSGWTALECNYSKDFNQAVSPDHCAFILCETCFGQQPWRPNLHVTAIGPNGHRGSSEQSQTSEKSIPSFLHLVLVSQLKSSVCRILFLQPVQNKERSTSSARSKPALLAFNPSTCKSCKLQGRVGMNAIISMGYVCLN